MILKIESPKIRSAETPREIIAEDFSFPDFELPILGGWGYSKVDAVIIDKNDPAFSQRMQFDDSGFIYVVEDCFVEKRIYEELTVFRPEEGRYFGIEWNLLSQKYIRSDDKTYDVLSFEVTAFPSSTWNKAKLKLETLYKHQVSDEKLTILFKKNNENQINYTTEYWFDISRFSDVDETLWEIPDPRFHHLTKWANKNDIPEFRFPRNKYELLELKELWIDNEDLLDLPSEIGYLKNLESLMLYKNKLSEIPMEIGLLHNLNFLWLSENNLTALPLEVGLLANLERLYLDDNNLTKFPAISGLSRLKTLDLGRNAITKLPAEIEKLSSLKRLMLYENKLTEVNPKISLLQTLEELILSKNNLTFLPLEIWKMQNLKVLSIDDNDLSVLEQAIGQLKNLRLLCLNGNNLFNIPQEISKLQHLEDLWIKDNKFSEIPYAICSIKTLIKLDGIKREPSESTKELIERCGYKLV